MVAYWRRVVGMAPARRRLLPVYWPRLHLPWALLDQVDLFQVVKDLLHRGPPLRVALEAREDQLGHQDGGFRRVLVPQPRVNELLDLRLLGEQGHGPLHQVVGARGPVVVECLEAGQQLQQNHPEPVDIALYVQMPCSETSRHYLMTYP